MAKKVSKKAPVAALAVHPDPEPSKVVKKKKNTKPTTAAVGAVAATTPSAPSTKASPKAAPEAAPAPASPKVKETAKKGKKRPAASLKQDAAEKNPKPASASAAPTHDQTLTCIDCSKGFVWTAKDQKIFTAKGYGNTPKRCRECRRVRNAHCTLCGGADHREADCTKGPSCHNCGQPGHVSAECSQPRVCRFYRAGKCVKTDCQFAHTK
eukprot:TRINITY_DN3622_c0_g1_i2.p1 TRINITY_DN3622_c0_g1~~TRINITY_DN3622_c0_g1_i2.p1  ORF type:complete len:217 (+),score=46.91 TRINITY_DN3622_c0_g1_i2:24-653(+)